MKESILKFSVIALILCSVSVFVYLNFCPATLPVDVNTADLEFYEEIQDSTHQTILLPDLDIIEKALKLSKQSLPFLSRF